MKYEVQIRLNNKHLKQQPAFLLGYASMKTRRAVSDLIVSGDTAHLLKRLGFDPEAKIPLVPHWNKTKDRQGLNIGKWIIEFSGRTEFQAKKHGELDSIWNTE